MSLMDIVIVIFITLIVFTILYRKIFTKQTYCSSCSQWKTCSTKKDGLKKFYYEQCEINDLQD